MRCVLIDIMRKTIRINGFDDSIQVRPRLVLDVLVLVRAHLSHSSEIVGSGTGAIQILANHRENLEDVVRPDPGDRALRWVNTSSTHT